MKDCQYTDFYVENENSVDYKAILTEYLLYWPYFLVC